MIQIKTSEKNWLQDAIKNYSEKKEFEFIDDAKIGIDEEDLKTAVNLIKAAKRKAKIPWKKIAQALASIGVSASGIALILIAIADPDPTSKLGLLIGGGIILAITGSLGLLASLGLKFSVSGGSAAGGFKIKPE